MRTSHPERTSLTDAALHSVQVEELLRFVDGLGTHSDPEHLLRSLPAGLGMLVASDAIALVFENDGAPSLYGVESDADTLRLECIA